MGWGEGMKPLPASPLHVGGAQSRPLVKTLPHALRARGSPILILQGPRRGGKTGKSAGRIKGSSSALFGHCETGCAITTTSR